MQSFSLANLELTLDGSTDFFGRLNAGNRILVSQVMMMVMIGALLLVPAAIVATLACVVWSLILVRYVCELNAVGGNLL